MSTSAEPIILDAMRPHDWRQLARAAALLDISEGDYFDVRAGAINLWAGPQNRPAGWPSEVPITAGDLPYPRAYVATITFYSGDEPPDWASDEVYPVALQIGIAAVAEWRVQHRRRYAGETFTGWLRRRDGQLDHAIARVVDDEAWCRRQWQRLKQYAEVGGT